MLKILFAIALTASPALAAKTEVSREPAAASSNITALKAQIGSGKFIFIQVKEAEGRDVPFRRDNEEKPSPQEILVRAAPGKSAVKVSGIANHDYFTVVQELCAPETVQPIQGEQFYCFTK